MRNVWEKAKRKLERGIPFCVVDLGSGWSGQVGECRDGIKLVEVRGRKGIFVRCEDDDRKPSLKVRQSLEIWAFGNWTGGG